MLIILGAAGAWIFVRRRRRIWAERRKAQGDPERSSNTPDAEMMNKVGESEKNEALDKEMRIDVPVEIGDGTRNWAELDDDK